MTENPQKENGFLPIANELAEALARTYLSSYESQFLWCLFRKTYGWGQKEDWIALSQIAEMTGIHLSHVSRTKKKLIERNIITQTGNKLAFNKFWSQWRRLPKQVTYHGDKTRNGSVKPISEEVARVGNPPAPAYSGNQTPPIQVIQTPPKQAGTIDTLTKETFTKERPVKKTISDEDAAERFWKIALEHGWTDEAYVEKSTPQIHDLAPKDREQVFRKMRVAINSAGHPSTIGLARKVYYEIAGLINDRGAMAHVLTDAEIDRRAEFLKTD